MLKQMMTIRVVPDVKLVSQSVLPLFPQSSQSVRSAYTRLRAAGLPYGVTVDSLMLHSLLKQDFGTACQIAKIYRR